MLSLQRSCVLSSLHTSCPVPTPSAVLVTKLQFPSPLCPQSGEGNWSLVTKTADGVGTGHEVWRDERTQLLWSDNMSSRYNWFQAAGYSCTGASCPGGSNSSTSTTGYEGAAGMGTDC